MSAQPAPAPRVAIIGVPTSAGSHHAGQDRAPAALRAAGFTGLLTEVNPSFEPTGATLGRYVNAVVGALSGVRAGAGEFGGPPAS